MRRAFCVLLLLVSCASPSRAQSPFKHDGFAGNHELYSELPAEHVDPLSGNLIITETDLVLPGNAGLDLVITRFYDSQVYPQYESGGNTTLEDDNWAGLGWQLHFGRVLRPDSTTPGQTVIELPGGGGGPLYRTAVYPEGWMTKGFARFDRSTYKLKLPNGRIYTFGNATTTSSGVAVRYVTKIEDPFGNHIDFSYFASGSGPTDGLSQIQQFLGAQTRTVTFTVNSAIGNSLATMSYAGRTWTYTQVTCGTGGRTCLTVVQPPAGRSTRYAYASNNGELTKVTTRNDGTLTYTYGAVTRYVGATTRPLRVVLTRTTGGVVAANAIPVGTTSYAYSVGSNKDESTVTTPCAVERYRFAGIGLAAPPNSPDWFKAWSNGTLVMHRTESTGGTMSQQEDYVWAKSEVISTDSIAGDGGYWSDAAVYNPLLSTLTTTRPGAGGTWTITNGYHWGLGNFNDYGQPYLTTMSGGFCVARPNGWVHTRVPGPRP